MKISFITISKNFPDNTSSACFTVTIRIDADAKKAEFSIRRDGIFNSDFLENKSFPNKPEYLYSQQNMIKWLEERNMREIEAVIDFIGNIEQRALGFC